MQTERLNLALERLEPHQWKLFEDFASKFLASYYPDLRTVASSSGDRGHDAELFSSSGSVKVVLQFSIARDWHRKILQTATRIQETLPDTQILVYVTNQSILASADDIKIKLRNEHGLVLDVHDMSWFLDRLSSDSAREIASEDLAKRIVDPFLSGRGVLSHSAPTLTSIEYQAALTFLQLQWEDDTRAKGLTRLSFEALVRTTLRNTDSNARVSRTEIYSKLLDLLPSHDFNRIEQLVDSALSRLSKGPIRHWRKRDEFCLSFEETQRVQERLARLEVANSKLDENVRIELERLGCLSKDIDVLSKVGRFSIDNFMLERGEMFATAVAKETIDGLGIEELRTAVDKTTQQELSSWPVARRDEAKFLVFSSIRELMTNPPEEVQSHLRAKADACTIFAFLGQTPDVQSAVSKMFAHGIIWLDTTIILPLFAETLITNGEGRFTKMVNVASRAGLNLRVTPGVIEEVERHMNQCLTYVRSSHNEWIGRIPFLVDAYLRSGRSLMAFGGWIETFEGQDRPEQDLAEYLEEFFRIQREGLEEDESGAAQDVRNLVQETWHNAHDR